MAVHLKALPEDRRWKEKAPLEGEGTTVHTIRNFGF